MMFLGMYTSSNLTIVLVTIYLHNVTMHWLGVDDDLAAGANDIFCTDELCDDLECGVSNGEEEEGVKCDHEPVTSFAKTLVAYETAK
jgi:hypothetical protein